MAWNVQALEQLVASGSCFTADVAVGTNTDCKVTLHVRSVAPNFGSRD